MMHTLTLLCQQEIGGIWNKLNNGCLALSQHEHNDQRQKAPKALWIQVSDIQSLIICINMFILILNVFYN